MNYKNGKIAQQIIEMQNEDGTWGKEFHSLSIPNNKKPLTTEQALRRLYYLGFTINDEPVRKTVDCMVSCLKGERKINNYWEKTRDWNEFTKLMLSTWVRIFEPNNETALVYVRHLAQKREEQFLNGTYDVDTGKDDFVTFYEMNLLQDLLSGETIWETAKRELREETGAIDFQIQPICVYSVKGKTRINENLPKESYGMLFVADITSFEKELHSEIEKIWITEQLPDNWTYPLIQPKLMEEAQRRGFI